MPRGRPKGSVNKPKIELATTMTDEQVKALKHLDRCMFRVIRAFKSLDMPYYDDVVDFDNAVDQFKYLFRKELSND